MARAKGIPALELYRLAQKKKRKLVLCGHSLGGAVSLNAFNLHFTSDCLFFSFNLLVVIVSLSRLLSWLHWPF